MRVQFKPEPLLSCQKLSYMGLEQSDNPQVIFNWNWTGTIWQHRQWPDVPVVNCDCLCTAKSYVDKIFRDIYGYSSEGAGPMVVEKPNDTNGAKDCRMVNFMQKRPGCFYQMPFLDGEELIEHRITVMDYTPVIVLLKYKTVTPDDLIGRVTRYEFIYETDSRVWEFCKRYPLEYGEIDALWYRDRFFIYDVNPTPGDAAFVKMPAAQSLEYQNRYKHHLYKWLTRII